MKILKASTKAGQRIINMGENCHCQYLRQLYDNWSEAKQRAYDWCLNQYYDDCESTAFGIGNANTFSFTASWLLTYNGENAMRVETKDNTYIVLLDR